MNANVESNQDSLKVAEAIRDAAELEDVNAIAQQEELQKEGMFLLILYFYMAVWVLVKLIYFTLWL